MASTQADAVTSAPAGPVLFAYDGSELAARAIEHGAKHLDATAADQVRKAAEQTAAHGASLAQQAGFQPQSVAIKAAPTWKGIIEVAEERDASLIVLGSHRRSGVVGHLLGSVAAAVVWHSAFSVLVVHQRS